MGQTWTARMKKSRLRSIWLPSLVVQSKLFSYFGPAKSCFHKLVVPSVIFTNLVFQQDWCYQMISFQKFGFAKSHTHTHTAMHAYIFCV